MIQLDRVSRRFGPRVLFDELSWLVPRKTRVGLVGPNGVGKTTLLRLLAGLDLPDRGAVRATGSVAVGYLPQEVETVARGSVLASVLDGWPEIRRMEEELEALAATLASVAPDDPELERTTRAYGELRDRFEREGGDRVESRAKAILTGLGVPEARFHEPLAALSGGWRMRAALARLLVRAPDLLLLDEPTNHLDLDALQWLESFLVEHGGSIVVVSHDRYFLNRVVRGIAELENGRLTHFPGTYDDYLVERERREEALEEEAKRQDREIARVRRFVERFRYKASKARQVQSRIKALEKLDRVEAPSSAPRVRFGFPTAPRSGEVVARLEGVGKAYGEIEVFRDASFLVRRGDRIAVVGPNGAGKSTLLSLLRGRVVPDSGEVEIGHAVEARHFAQHHLEALDPEATVLDEAARDADPEPRSRLRSILGGFLFHGDEVDKRVAVLSGGEKARLALAKLLLRPCNLLLLDEPTNHLDMRSREVLEDALDEYAGALVVVSHDRYFINRVATSVAVVEDGGVSVFPGDYDAWVEARAAATPEAGDEADSREGPPRARDLERERRRAEAEERKRRYRKRRAFEDRLRPVEAEIERLEGRLAEIGEAQGDPETYRDPDRARELGRERSEVEARLHDLWGRWQEIAEETPD